MMANKVIHGYWAVRGAAQVSRLLLAYCGATWEDVKYDNPDQWFGKDKQQLGFAFPNLPYLINGDLKLSEASAINRYIPKRFGKEELLGKDIKDQAMVDNILGVFYDLRKILAPLFWDKEWESKLQGAFEKADPKIESLSKFYGEK